MSTPEKTRHKVHLAVFASGNGSNLEAIINAASHDPFPAKVQAVLSDKKDAFALERAKKHNIPAVFIDPKTFETKEDYEQMLISTLKEYKIDYVILAGFMRVLSPYFVKAYKGKILNIHPALLPKYPGLHAAKKALAAGDTVTGCTVHFVDEGIDTGPVILQKEVPIESGDTENTLMERIHKVEHEIYPKAIETVICGHHSKAK